MTTSRLLSVLAALGLAAVAVSVLLFALAVPRWAAVLLAAGTGAVLAGLLATVRRSLRELRTMKSSLARSRREQAAEARELAAALSRLISTTAEEGEAAVGPVRPATGVGTAVDPAGRDAGAEGPVRERLAAPQTRPLVAWERLREERREGPCLLVMDRADAAAVAAAETAAVPFEVVDPAAGPHGLLAAVPPHAVGALVLDLDRFDPGAAGDAWRRFVHWMRPETPVAGFTREPGRLALRAASLSRASGGRLLPARTGDGMVRLDRAAGPLLEAEPPPAAAAGAPRAPGSPGAPGASETPSTRGGARS